MSAVATLLYSLTTGLASFIAMMPSMPAKYLMGPSIRRSSCLAHRMSPATGGAFLGNGGACFCFS